MSDAIFRPGFPTLPVPSATVRTVTSEITVSVDYLRFMLAFVTPLSDPANWEQQPGNATPEECAATFADFFYALQPK